MSVLEFSVSSWRSSVVDLLEKVRGSEETLEQLYEALKGLSNSPSISGHGADAMRAYIDEAHLRTLRHIFLAFEAFELVVGKYAAEYESLDSGEGLWLVAEELEDHVDQLADGSSQMEQIASRLRALAAQASGLAALGDAGASKAERVSSSLGRMRTTADSLHSNWSALEARDLGFSDLEDFVSDLTKIVEDIGTGKMGVGHDYQIGSVALAFMGLEPRVVALGEFYDQNVTDAASALQVLVDTHNRHSEESANRWAGGWKIAGGILMGIVTVGAVIATGGAAVPVVLAGVSVAYSASEVYEGSQMVSSGEASGYNPMRDGLFGGNELAYHGVGVLSSLGAGTAAVGSARVASLATSSVRPLAPMARGVVWAESGTRTVVSAAGGTAGAIVVASGVESVATRVGVDELTAQNIAMGATFAFGVRPGKGMLPAGSSLSSRTFQPARNVVSPRLSGAAGSKLGDGDLVLPNSLVAREAVRIPRFGDPGWPSAIRLANGLVLPGNKQGAITALQKAGYQQFEPRRPGVGFTIPGQPGVHGGKDIQVRVMEPSGPNPLRIVVNIEGTNTPLSPFTFKQVQPPTGLTRGERGRYIGPFTHYDLGPRLN